ncbi:sugar fermentation stimulation protein [Ruminiclostridium sufflavum DSM 19573]|uniref:Sugar fermentation stimulation protein homolog n=1 Tax=Ruminiclostridium sufflavum DSM 19573 TaxID=1121337 RepID=A0A318XTN3_9FIRM|nr:DNA/RNA nuclease SfsA [Ruminiclostridium sufflavum]PYG90203.1 sugar fermentation stimulation protein [Ruminiclostridium sufflavum DSM 19573]
MKYNNVQKAKFIERPNRFIAYAEINGAVEICHVKNTGRCRELLQRGCTVYLEESSNLSRKTRYDIIAAEKGKLLINMDSQAPNKAVREWLEAGGLYDAPALIKPEMMHGDSRVDFYIEDKSRKAFIEVKGVTLEKDGVAAFPDAPTERGVKHIRHLIDAMKEGYEAYLLFVIQFKPAKYIIPNDVTHPEFGSVLREAATAGVKVLAYDCKVTPDSMQLDSEVPVKLQ